MLTKLEELEQKLYDLGFRIIKDDTIEGIAFLIKHQKYKNIMVYAPGKILNNRELRCVFLHELYHNKVKNGFHYMNDSVYKVKRIERAVKIAMIKDILPLKLLLKFLKIGRANHEIAEELEVTDEFIKDACDYYCQVHPTLMSGINIFEGV